MSTGQTILAMAALILFINIGTFIQRAQLNALADSMDHQVELEAVNYGQSIMESVLYSVNEFDELDAMYGNLTDVTDPESRLTYKTAMGDTLYATIDLSSEKIIAGDVHGREVTARVYRKSDDDYLLATEYSATVNPIWK